MLCVVGDAHYLDDGSAAARLFAARLDADSVAVVFGAGDGSPVGRSAWSSTLATASLSSSGLPRRGPDRD